MPWKSIIKPVYWFFLLALSGIGQSQADWLKQSRNIMGTLITVELWSENPPRAKLCSEQVFTEMHRIDALMSPFKSSSELSDINQHASQRAVPVSSELFDLIQQSIHFSDQSSGAFDITFASIGFKYDYRLHKKPDLQTIRQNLKAINYKNLILKNQSVKFSMPDMSIDLGGIAKGYAVDQAIKILQQCGIQQALVSAGGDSKILGDKRGRPWVIGIQHPRKKQAVALSIPLTDTAISTSGDYERFFLSNNERIHHIINPRTGKSAKQSWSATVIGPNAVSTDALSTTIFILGAEEGLKLINSLDNIDAIIIDSNGVVHYSSGLEDPA